MHAIHSFVLFVLPIPYRNWYLGKMVGWRIHHGALHEGQAHELGDFASPNLCACLVIVSLAQLNSKWKRAYSTAVVQDLILVRYVLQDIHCTSGRMGYLVHNLLVYYLGYIIFAWSLRNDVFCPLTRVHLLISIINIRAT